MHRSSARPYRGMAAALAAAASLWFAPAWAQSLADTANRGVVELETGRADGISAKIAADIAELIDDGSTRRVVPVIGKGSQQNIIDLKALRGIDMSLIQADVLENARTQKLVPGVETLTYIAKLYNEEFHLLARKDIKGIEDLAGQKVDFDQGGAEVTAGKIFGLLNIKVVPSNDAASIAVQKLVKGDIAAIAYVGAKPTPLFRDIQGADGLHFLSIPLKSVMTAGYAPTRLTAQDYPGLVPSDGAVDTVAVGTLLLAANLQPGTDRARNLANFVDVFFTRFPTLLEPGHHPKWREVNLAADVPGMRRYPPAEQWLTRNTPVAATKQATPADMKSVFERFLEERLRLSGAQGMSQDQKDSLFSQFQRWQAGQQVR